MLEVFAVVPHLFSFFFPSKTKMSCFDGTKKRNNLRHIKMLKSYVYFRVGKA